MKSKNKYFVAVLDGNDETVIKDLRDLVARCGGSVRSEEQKEQRGKLFTGLGIYLPKSKVEVFNGLCANCWRLFEKEPPKDEPEADKCATDEKGYNTGLPELDRYLSKVEKKVSPNELHLLIPSGINPRFEGYAAFTRNGEHPLCGGRIPEGGL